MSAYGHIKRAVAAASRTTPHATGGTPAARLVWPLALACGVLVIVTGISIYLVFSARATGELVNRALRVQTELNGVLATLRDAESSQRGYLLTEDVRYLNIYRKAEKAVEPALTGLKNAIIDPSQRSAYARIEPLVQRKRGELAEAIRLHDSGQSANAVALVRTAGFDLMGQIRSMAKDMENEEEQLLSARSSNSALVNSALLAASLIGLALVIIMAAVSVVVMRRVAETEMAHVAELKQSNQELDEFAHVVSHDLKEPLRGLVNHAAFLLEDYQDKLDADGVRRLNRLGQLGQRMERLINDLLYYSRLGHGDLAVQDADLNVVIDEIKAMMEMLLVEKHARIAVPRALPRIVCDKTRVTEVFRNLITNAVKYNDNPDALVEIGFLGSVATPERVEKNVFYVRDNGIGIDPEFHQVIFRMFKRIHGKSDEAGSGVGLTFVKKIVERHGGRIWLDSGPGQGTTFYFTLNCEPNPSKKIVRRQVVGAAPLPAAG